LKSSYIVSKIALSALTRIQSRQLATDQRADIAVNHVHPGFVATDINKHMGHLTTDR
jgi:NAD(P)-dependent dehydrogenase (short-subunit alcohol dehydrogenase family)